ncbi:23S rRNA (adenine(2503)-C(2))-methyltransferase RlmN [Bacillaceae bacterium SIJ1]|uniref:23S rRNA (adenine(2503)-C(2))-methyltransferase RlmN n=1 Tax=Litoribacterium kuwaitense TaxID=1398745 RepID=UPI0013EAC100|nr:23S rRNA (adenine(2503)-C(2))-methyltransferase RlmN [Litoribacterium kuwaitense]NGP45050.1 23S rRNA (adenine(2503)-C(2))-methyltransferase RlmN [Litoribacterium kuwaitense]
MSLLSKQTKARPYHKPIDELPSIYSLELHELEGWLKEEGQPAFRAEQIYSWLYEKRVFSFDDMTNLPKALRERLEESFDLTTLKTIVQQKAEDGTMKFLFELTDGFSIETVLMKHDYGYSVCVTTQVGCRIGCTFCASTLGGLKRHLEAGEIVAQVVKVQQVLDDIDARLGHVVVMGIGEPFDNYDELMSFLRIINHEKSLNIGARHITVSTSGIVPKMYDFADEGLQINFALSLHAPTQEMREQLMPIARAYKLEPLMESVKYYTEKTGRRITFEYGLFGGVNDQEEHALKLAKLIKPIKCHVNLIPVNYVPERDYVRTPQKQIQKFVHTLRKQGVNATVRREQGHDIDAACGQLRAKERKEETR